MKSLKILFLSLFVLILVNSCKKEVVFDEETGEIEEVEEFENYDLAITTEARTIYWDDSSTLQEIIKAVYTLHTAGVSDTTFTVTHEINEDYDNIIISIDFTKSSKFTDPDTNNNWIELPLVNNADRNFSFEEMSPLQATKVCDMEDILKEELASYNFNIKDEVCIGLAFIISDQVRFNNSDLERVMSLLNKNFEGTKISFSREVTAIATGEVYENINTDNISNYNMDVSGLLNIYVGKVLKSKKWGEAYFPTENIDKVFMQDIFDRYNDPNCTALTHELGHTFSLLHPFHATSSIFCNIENDGIETTPFDSWVSLDSKVPSTYGTSCSPSNSDQEVIIKNYMSYSLSVNQLKACERYFVPEQQVRMRFAVERWLSRFICNSLPKSEISVPEKLSFPITPINTTTTKSFKISNIGNKNFDITDIIAPVGFKIINGQSKTLVPNEIHEILVEFNPTESKTYQDYITIENTADNTNSTSIRIEVQGTVGYSSIQLNGDLDFDAIPIGSTSEYKTFDIKNSGSKNFVVTDISAPDGFKIINGQTKTLVPDEVLTVSVLFEPKEIKEYSDYITVANTAENATSTNSRISVSGKGEAISTSIISLAGDLGFGYVDVDSTETRSFKIINKGSKAFNVTSISKPSWAIISGWNNGTITAGDSQNVQISVTPTSLTSYTGWVTVNSDANEGLNLKTISCIGSAIYVGVDAKDINDDNIGNSSGNNNGRASPGEDIEMTVNLTNIWANNLTNVSGTLSCSDPDIIITQATKSFGNVPGSGIRVNNGFYEFKIPSTYTKSLIDFSMVVTSDQGSQYRWFRVSVW